MANFKDQVQADEFAGKILELEEKIEQGRMGYENLRKKNNSNTNRNGSKSKEKNTRINPIARSSSIEYKEKEKNGNSVTINARNTGGFQNKNH
jgi:hypothetical protein